MYLTSCWGPNIKNKYNDTLSNLVEETGLTTPFGQGDLPENSFFLSRPYGVLSLTLSNTLSDLVEETCLIAPFGR